MKEKDINKFCELDVLGFRLENIESGLHKVARDFGTITIKINRVADNLDETVKLLDKLIKSIENEENEENEERESNNEV